MKPEKLIPKMLATRRCAGRWRRAGRAWRSGRASARPRRTAATLPRQHLSLAARAAPSADGAARARDRAPGAVAERPHARLVRDLEVLVDDEPTAAVVSPQVADERIRRRASGPHQRVGRDLAHRPSARPRRRSPSGPGPVTISTPRGRSFRCAYVPSFGPNSGRMTWSASPGPCAGTRVAGSDRSAAPRGRSR